MNRSAGSVSLIVFRRCCLVAIAAAMASPSHMYANTVPAAYFAAFNTTESGPGTFTNGSNSITETYANNTAAMSGSGSGTSGFGGEIDFYFELFGPAGSVPMELVTTPGGGPVVGMTSDTGGLYVTTTVEVGPGSLVNLTACSSGFGFCNGAPSSFSSTPSFDVNTGQVYDISLRLRGGDIYGGTWTSSLDPTVEIDPTFIGANQYALEFSPSPTNAVPEPSSISYIPLACLCLSVAAAIKGRRGRRTPMRS